MFKIASAIKAMILNSRRERITIYDLVSGEE